MRHDVDPKQELLGKLPTDGVITTFHNQVLVAIYIRPKVTAGGIHITDETRKEDEYQGKVGLVIDKGPLAFKDDGRNQFHGQDVEIGEWIVFRASDGFQLHVGDVLCRVLQDVDLKARVSSPDLVF